MTLATERHSPQSSLRLQLITQLVRKDLKIKYQGSTLGFMWSLANPLLLLVVYTFVFQYVFKSNVPIFGYFLLSGLLVFNLFQMGVMGASTSITGNAGLVKKVPFPHIALPLASIGFAGVQVALQYVVLIVAMVVLRCRATAPRAVAARPGPRGRLTMTVGLSLFVASIDRALQGHPAHPRGRHVRLGVALGRHLPPGARARKLGGGLKLSGLLPQPDGRA